MNRKAVAGVGAGIVLLAGGLVAGGTVADVQPVDETTTVVETQLGIGPDVQLTLAPDERVGPCSIVDPAIGDPCENAQGTLRYIFWGAMVNSKPWKAWKNQNPGEFARLQTVLAAPMCSTFSNPQPQIMTTFFGASLVDAVQAYACALGAEPIVLPSPNPPPVAGATDKTPPTAPGPIHVGP